MPRWPEDETILIKMEYGNDGLDGESTVPTREDERRH